MNKAKINNSAVLDKERLPLLQELFDSIPDAIYFKDVKGRLVLVNKAHAAGLGLAPEDVVGRKDFDFFPHHQALRMTQDDRKVMRTGLPLMDILERTTRPDGSHHYVSTTKLPRRDERGKIIGVMGVTRDITERTRMQEDRYRVLFETSQNCIFITTKTGEWVDINEAGVRLFGYEDKKEFLKTKVMDIYADPKDRQAYIRKMAREHFVNAYELDLKRKDGRIIHTLVTSAFRKDKKNRIAGYQGTILDITARKQAEEERGKILRHLNARVKELSCLYRIEEARRKENITIDQTLKEIISFIPSSWQYPDITACRIILKNTVYQTKNFKTTPWTLRAHIIAHGRRVGAIEVCYLKQKPDEFRGPFVKPETELVEVIAQRLGLLVERRLMDDALRKLLKELTDIKFALDASSIVAITDRNGKITFANDKFCEVSKYSREELIGQDHRVLKSGYHSQEFMKNLWATVARGQVWKGEICNKAKDGTLHWLDTTIIPFLSNKGKPYQYATIRSEITQRKQMEETLKDLPQKIIQAQESERNKISRDIHDDLGQSLATLKMHIQSIANIQGFAGTVSKAAYDKVINQVDAAIQKSRYLASGLRPTILEILGLSKAIEMLINDFRQKKGMRIYFHCDRLSDLGFQGEVINLYRIIQEALSNVVVHASATRVLVSLQKKKNHLRVMIKDNGKGFAVNKAAGLPPSFRGIGLSTMQERAKLLGADLSIYSQPGKGTAIVLMIPVAAGKKSIRRF